MAKKSKNVAAAGEGYAKAYKIEEEVGVSNFASRPGLLRRQATIVATIRSLLRFCAHNARVYGTIDVVPCT